ncbi:MAG: MFS transporter, partial [Armatimonadetes bacterium]|nr:MFS transporter [Anaerolineae bacterium]
RANPDFARLWLANVISLTGDWFNTIVLLSLVERYSPGNGGLAISGLLLARALPPMLLSPLAGTLIDRFDRKQLLIWSSLLRAVVVLGFLLTLERPDLLWLIYVLTVAQFTLASIFEPCQTALINNVCRPEDLVAANTLYTITWSAILAFGAALGGIVATLFGASFALVFDALTFVLGAWLIWRIRSYQFTPPVPDSSSTAPDTSIGEGVRYVRARPAIASLLFVKFGSSLGNVDTLMAIYATQVFILGVGGQLSLGIMYSAFGVGAVLGPLLLNRFSDGSALALRRLITISFVLTTVCWLVMGAASVLWVFCVGLIIRAMGGSSNWTYSTILLQQSTHDRYMGRVFSLDMMMYYIASVGSTLVHGSLVDALNTAQLPWVSFLTLGVAGVALVVWIVVNQRAEAKTVLSVE